MRNYKRRNRRVVRPNLETLEGKTLLSGMTYGGTVDRTTYYIPHSLIWPGPMPIGKQPIQEQHVISTKTLTQNWPGNGQNPGETFTYTVTTSADATWWNQRLASGPSAHPQTTVQSVVRAQNPDEFTHDEVAAAKLGATGSGSSKDKWITIHFVGLAEVSQVETLKRYVNGVLMNTEIVTQKATVQADEFDSFIGSTFSFNLQFNVQMGLVFVHQPYTTATPSMVDLKAVDLHVTVDRQLSASKEYAYKGAVVMNVTSMHQSDPETEQTPTELTTASALASYNLTKGHGNLTQTMDVGAHLLYADSQEGNVASALGETSVWSQGTVTANGSKLTGSGNILLDASSTAIQDLGHKQVPITAHPGQAISGQVQVKTPTHQTGNFTKLRDLYNRLVGLNQP